MRSVIKKCNLYLRDKTSKVLLSLIFVWAWRVLTMKWVKSVCRNKFIVRLKRVEELSLRAEVVFLKHSTWILSWLFEALRRRSCFCRSAITASKLSVLFLRAFAVASQSLTFRWKSTILFLICSISLARLDVDDSSFAIWLFWAFRRFLVRWFSKVFL